VQFIFSYGTLQEEPVQIATFGRTVDGSPDQLFGYERVSLTLTDPDLVAATGRALHTNLARSSSRDSAVAGTCLNVTDSELELCDRYERLAAYRRQLLALESGKLAWVYTFAGNSGE
jgi:hypothetical protein